MVVLIMHLDEIFNHFWRKKYISTFPQVFKISINCSCSLTHMLWTCTQPKTIQTCQQVATNLSISSSCNKSVRIRLVAFVICRLVTACWNTLQQICWTNQLATSLLTTYNRLPTSFRKPCERILTSAGCNKLSKDVNRLATTCAFLAVYVEWEASIILINTNLTR